MPFHERVRMNIPDGMTLVEVREKDVRLCNTTTESVRDPQICGGEPIFRGTRVTLRTILASLAAGDTTEHILTDFPALKAEDCRPPSRWQRTE